MTKAIETLSGQVLRLLMNKEDARIRAGIAADPDTHEVSNAALASMRRPGRPVKQKITLRLDDDLIDTFKASVDGWHIRINEVVRAHA